METVETIQEIEVQLPPMERYPQKPGFYGADVNAAEYCGLKNTPEVPGVWQHGWTPSYWRPIHPDMVMGETTNPHATYFVARKDEENFLKGFDYPNVKAIGLPIIYARRRKVQRRPGSLLVMPAHSIEYTTHTWRFDEYADQIDAIRSSFSSVVVCVHPVCWQRGYWVDAFRKRGIQLVQGAANDDRNAHRRLCALLESFEYLTTNSIGSQVAYGAYLGAKVSIFGTYATVRAEDYADTPFYMANPQLLRPMVEAYSEAFVRNQCPDLFCHPLEAKQRIDWGRHEVGANNRISAAEMRSLFGWGLRQRACQRVKTSVPNRVKHLVKLAVSATYRAGQRSATAKTRELARLRDLPRNVPTTTELLGRPFQVNDGPIFAELYSHVWERGLYRFRSHTDSPLIIDGGANIGMSVLYFKRLFPKSRILAFEPDPRLFPVLKQNCEQSDLSNVQLNSEALWSSTGQVLLQQKDTDGGRIVSEQTGQVLTVSARRLRDLLVSDVDMLKLDIEGSEREVLRDCGAALDRVKNLFIRYYSFPERAQDLDEVLNILKTSGFRYHVESVSVCPQPLYWRPLWLGTDMRLNIFAYRTKLYG